MTKVGEVQWGCEGALLNLLWCMVGTYKVHLAPLAPATSEFMCIGLVSLEWMMHIVGGI
jgi:hypothetical protein